MTTRISLLAIAVVAGACHAGTKNRGARHGFAPVAEAALPALLDGDVLVLTWKGELVRADPVLGKTAVVMKLPLTEEESPTGLVVREHRAWASTRISKDKLGLAYEDLLYEIDLDGRRALRRPSPGGWIMELFADGTALFRTNGLAFVHLADGRVVSRVPIPGVTNGWRIVGTRLYVTHSYPGGLVVVDLTNRQSVAQIETERWLYQVLDMRGNELLIGELSGIGKLDVESGRYTPLPEASVRLPPDLEARARANMPPGVPAFVPHVVAVRGNDVLFLLKDGVAITQRDALPW